MRKSLSILLIILAIVPGLKSQEKFIEKFSFSTWFGARSITCDSFPDGGNLDFLNYLYDANGSIISPDYGYFGMASHLWLRGNWELDEHHYSKFDVDVGIYLRFPADPHD